MTIEENLNKISNIEKKQPVDKPESNAAEQIPETTEEQRHETVEALAQERDQVTEDLAKVREKFGIPQTDEAPPSVKILNEQILKNSNEDSQPKKELDIKVERQKYLKFIDSAKTIVGVLGARNSNNLSQLLDDASLSSMRSAISKTEGLFSEKKLDQDTLNEQIFKFARTIDSIGEVKRGGKEDMDSLTAVITKLKGLSAECGDLIRIIQKSDTKEKTEHTTKMLDRLSASCESKSKLLFGMRDAFARYVGRR